MKRAIVALVAVLAITSPANATYWNLFNSEADSTQGAIYDTYATRTDMLNDTNRLAFYSPNGGGAAKNVVGTGSDGTVYWNLFNSEADSTQVAIYDTYATLTDMLNDTNRLAFYSPNGGGAARNVVGTGFNGSVYWNLFNSEGDSTQVAIYDTYATLTDMLNDTNRLAFYSPNGGGAAKNVIDGGSDGSVYWNLFNSESDSTQIAIYDTYATLNDMLNDTNRLAFFSPNGGGAAKNVVGSGSDNFGALHGAVPEPGSWVMMLIGLGAVGLTMRRRQKVIAQFPCALYSFYIN